MTPRPARAGLGVLSPHAPGIVRPLARHREGHAVPESGIFWRRLRRECRGVRCPAGAGVPAPEVPGAPVVVHAVWRAGQTGGGEHVARRGGLRALARQPESAEAFLAELDASAGAGKRLGRAVAGLRRELAGLGQAGPGQAGARARRIAETLAVVLQGALLVRCGDPAGAASAAGALALAGDWGRAFGTLPGEGAGAAAIVKRAAPSLDAS